MDLVAGAMGNLAPKLLQLLQDEYKLQKGLRDEVKSLAQELESTHVALCKVAQVPPDQLDPQVKLWARDVREASYDMEDVLDTFLVRVDGGGDDHTDKGKFERLREKMGMLFSLSKLKARHDIARAIKDIKKQIQEKCGGIPLAIITMASLLVGKSRGEWFEVCNSIGFRDKDIEQVDITMRILSLSYYDLPSHLRTCLLYLSAFPEDYIIDKNSLIWRWIAEDFVHKKPNIGLFGVGEGYFNDLVNRSMIQAVESQCKGIIDGCRVHDMVFDLLRSLSREENFFTVLLDNDEGTSSVNTARRFSHRKNTLDPHLDNHNNKGMQKMRSFVAYSCHDDKELSFQSFKLLRVLDLEDVYMKSWHNAKHLGNLLHLRYLGLKRTSMLELPKEIGTLKFLQTLDLVKNYGIVELPSSLGQLSQLVCLRVWGKYHWKMSIPGGMIKKLTSLEELVVQCNEDRDKDYEGQFKELGSLSELRVLTIKVIEMTQRMFSDLLQSIGNLHKMQSLKIERHDYSYGLQNATFDAVALPQHLRHLLVGVHCFSRFPSCINPSSLINLSHLEIKVNDMDEQSMQLLARLPELRHLELSTKSKSKVTVSNKATDSCFQKLRICRFYSSVVLFVLNEDLSVSFTLWMGMGETILFGSTKKNESRRPPSAFMPNLQELLFKIDCFSMRKCAGHYGNLGLEYLISLKEVTVFVDCYHCSSEAEVMEAEAGLRHAVGVHPNHPALSLKRHNERRWTYKMKWYASYHME
ncbi:hypothetical protein HU200_028050 [Digitaria exilis]|uniref:Uncharacterized protein n=1 Tax=Digitaria exilis TaxID=1010633 RepID=A0A835BWU8_9POAL|nr:hypothetical protein HU200_028050 [Digitaria exilis]